MSSFTKFFGSAVILVILFVGGIILGIRGCLSKYDLRYAIPPPAFTGEGDSAIVVSLVKFSKTSSYEQRGGVTSKSYSSSYYIQTNRAATGEKINAKKIHGDDRLKNYPERIIGTSENNAWIFLDKLLAYDVSTLKKIADIEILEGLNPVLKGKFPAEIRYYRFNKADKNISITANDGSLWLLNTKTLKVSPEETNNEKKMHERKTSQQQRAESLMDDNISFDELSINQDTTDGNWFGIYAKDELPDGPRNTPQEKAYGSDTRRQFIKTTYTYGEDKRLILDKANASILNPNTMFLDGGFLLDRQTGAVIKLSNPGGFLVVYKDKIGNEGLIVIARINTDGKVLWTFNTGFQQWIDWKLTGKQMVIFGNNRKELSSSNCSLFINVDINSGKAVEYDYFKDKAGVHVP